MASYPSPQREPLLDSRLQAVLSQRGKELLGLCLIGAGLLLALTLGSYSPDDPSWWAATDAPAGNAFGRAGAGIAGPLMFMIGKASWGLVLALCAWGLRLVIHHGEHNILGRTLFVPIAIALATVWLAMLVPSAAWVADNGLGGQFGDAVLGAILTALPLTSTFGFNILTILIFGLTVGLWFYVLGSSIPELWRIGAFLLSGIILSYAAFVTMLGGSLRGMGGLAVRGQHGLQARREAHHQARVAAQHAAAAHPAWQEPAVQWPDHDHAYRAPRIHRAEAAPDFEDYGAEYGQQDAYQPDPYHQPEYAQAAPRNPDVHTRVPMHGQAASQAASQARQPERHEPPIHAPQHMQQPAEHWGQPERGGLLARVSNLGRRRPEPEARGWQAPDAELIEPGMTPQAMVAQAPTNDHIRSRITDVIRTRKQVKPVLRFDPNQHPNQHPTPQAPPQQAPQHVEPPLTAMRREPTLNTPQQVAPGPAPQMPAQGFGFSHSFDYNPTPSAYPGSVPMGFEPASDPRDALIEDVDASYDGDRYEAPSPRGAQPVLNRRVVQTSRSRTPAPSKQAKAEAQPTLPFEPRRQAFELPPLNLLSDPTKVERYSLSNEALEENARMLESVLEDYGVRGEIVSVRPGPVVTMYELEPAPGLKASRVIGLSDDIARSMSALSARVSTVPGRSVIGIELPNVRREKVVLREILGSRDFGDSNMRLPLALGKDIGGESIVANLAKMPHLLIAGTTGSGKSVAINTMILSLLYKLTPEECRLIMIDPKMLELSVYDGIPHLLSPVVTDPKKAVVALKWVVGEMEERYRKMSKMGVRNIDGYNGRVREALGKDEMFKRTVQTGFDDETGDPVFETEEFAPEVLPFIVVVVDEMADLMMVAGKEIEACIQRLAQMARASGIHLIMATQRPSVDVITGTIKANFPTRISYMVTTKIDSRTILNEQGAEQLLGMGDLLYQAPGKKSQRLHGPFVSDEEVGSVVDWLKEQGEPDYVMDILEAPEDGSTGSAVMDAMLGTSTGDEDEDLFAQAIAIVVRDKRASTSYLQRRLKVGYNKAAGLIDRLEEDGIVSAPNHAGRREVLANSGPSAD